MDDFSNPPQQRDARLSRNSKLGLILGACAGIAVLALTGIIVTSQGSDVSAPSGADSGSSDSAGGSTPGATSDLGENPEQRIPATAPTPETTPKQIAPVQSADFDSDTAQALLANYFAYADGFAPDSAQEMPPTDALTAIAGDLVIDELEAQFRELEAEGWSRSGTPEIVSIEIIDDAFDSVNVEVCLDSSAVSTRDFAGDLLPKASTPRATNIFIFEQEEDQAWRIVAHKFPDDPAC